MRPLIGITTYQILDTRGYYDRVNNFYSQSVLRGGGIPVLLPSCEDTSLAMEYLSKLDGIVFTGGNEFINPKYYGAEPSKYTTLISPLRDEWELALAKGAISMNMPILGICRGHQLLNVATGGSLYYNIPNEVVNAIGHSAGKTDMSIPYHNISIIDNSKLYEIFGKSDIEVNSYHSQAVKDLSPDFRAVAYSSDGIIEAIEHKKNTFTIGVQCHPEALSHKYCEFESLFKSLVEEAKK